MKKTLPALLLGCLLAGACSKSGTSRELSQERPPAPNVARVTDGMLPPAPMPVDTLAIDSLRTPQTN